MGKWMAEWMSWWVGECQQLTLKLISKWRTVNIGWRLSAQKLDVFELKLKMSATKNCIWWHTKINCIFTIINYISTIYILWQNSFTTFCGVRCVSVFVAYDSRLCLHVEASPINLVSTEPKKMYTGSSTLTIVFHGPHPLSIYVECTRKKRH